MLPQNCKKESHPTHLKKGHDTHIDDAMEKETEMAYRHRRSAISLVVGEMQKKATTVSPNVIQLYSVLVRIWNN